QRAGRGARQLSKERISADYRRRAVEAATGTCRSRARDPARGHGARRGRPHAEDGGGAEGSDRARRTDASHRIHVEPVANPPPRRPRGDGGDLNNFDRQTETRFITSLEEENRESAERIKALMFTFDDLVKLDAASAQTLMRHVDKDKLGVALKSANEEVRGFFLGNMSSRAGKMLLDDMAALGPVRLRDVDEAQALLVNLAKDLAAKGEIMLTKNRADDELVY